MEKIIKYKRFDETHDINTLNKFFDDLITEGWEIIYYNEHKMAEGKLHVTIVACKKQNNII